MIIKFKDKFESIFYSVLYSNLTGYYLSSQNEPDNLFKEETFIDVEKLNWQAILQQHNQQFGQINWLKNQDEQFRQFKNTIELALRHWKQFKYKLIIETIRQALRFGLVYVNNKTSIETRNLFNLASQVKKEVHRVLGFIRFIPIERGKEKFLLAYFEEESRVGDLVINNFKNKYFGYNLLIKTPRIVYFFYQQKLYQLATEKFDLQITKDNFDKFWEVFYQANFIPERKNTKLAQKLIPQKYWSWLKEGRIINQVDKNLI
jgi:probable DNA metabolism protein